LQLQLEIELLVYFNSALEAAVRGACEYKSLQASSSGGFVPPVPPLPLIPPCRRQ
jgi:hypothetical protein